MYVLRNQIIEDVWDIHFDYDTGVDVFINAIRKKLNLKNREQDYIKTSVGYNTTIKVQYAAIFI
jgi:DNA-binding response OmpR family regulator